MKSDGSGLPWRHPFFPFGTLVCVILILFLLFTCITTENQSQENDGQENHDDGNSLFDFVIPWDDGSETAIHYDCQVPGPAGKDGFIFVNDTGHLADKKGRKRFWGVNTCFGANFPTHKDAEKIARHMAKFGINMVRFHHMDMSDAPSGIWKSRNPERELDNDQVDKLDYFISRLKQNGIYIDLNLLVSRPFHKGPELHPDIEKVSDWKERAVIGMFNKDMIGLQKRYAKDLLTHKNPYTGLAYTEDPAIAFIEVNNENGLVHAYLGGQLDHLPGYYRDELKASWNTWLQSTYSSQEELEAAWNVTVYPPGEELLVNGDFSADRIQPWNLEHHDTAMAEATIVKAGPGGKPGAKVTITETGSLSWHVQFNQGGLLVKKNFPYNLRFFAKADSERKISVSMGMAHAPWQNLGFQAEIHLTEKWQEFVFSPFTLHTSDSNARLNFGGMGLEKGTIWIAGVTLIPGGTTGLEPGENLREGTIENFIFREAGGRTDEGKKDWFRFLLETEESYWITMRDFIKNECGARSLIFGTVIGCSTPNIMADFDVIDSHSYWCHPVFPNKAWDYKDWYVENQCMINHPGRSTVAGLSMKAVHGFPHSVSEYNHSHPNTFQAEAFFLLATYASLQDWDAVIPFTYSHRTDEWNARKIPNYFDIDQNPTKYASFIPAARAFRQFHIQPAKKLVAVPFSQEKEIDLLLSARAWKLVDASSADLDQRTGLIHRVRLVTGAGEHVTEDRSPGDLDIPEDVFLSDTGEILWDVSEEGRGVLQVTTEKSLFLAGFTGGKSFQFPGVSIQPGHTLQDGFSCVALTLLDGDSFSGPAHFLITAVGAQDNTDSKWFKYPDTPVSFPPGEGLAITLKNYFGKTPSRVEGVPAFFSLSPANGNVQVWALDETGKRKAGVPVKYNGEGAQFTIGPEYKAVWYEVMVE